MVLLAQQLLGRRRHVRRFVQLVARLVQLLLHSLFLLQIFNAIKSRCLQFLAFEQATFHFLRHKVLTCTHPQNLVQFPFGLGESVGELFGDFIQIGHLGLSRVFHLLQLTGKHNRHNYTQEADSSVRQADRETRVTCEGCCWSPACQCSVCWAPVTSSLDALWSRPYPPVSATTKSVCQQIARANEMSNHTTTLPDEMLIKKSTRNTESKDTPQITACKERSVHFLYKETTTEETVDCFKVSQKLPVLRGGIYTISIQRAKVIKLTPLPITHLAHHAPCLERSSVNFWCVVFCAERNCMSGELEFINNFALKRVAAPNPSNRQFWILPASDP